MTGRGNWLTDYGTASYWYFLLSLRGRQQQANIPGRPSLLGVYVIAIQVCNGQILLCAVVQQVLPVQIQIQTVMRAKSKTNLSFVSNQQLIENLRARPSKHMSRNRSVQTSISLIERKNYDHDICSSNTNISTHNSTHNQNVNPNMIGGEGRKSSNSNSKLVRFLKDNITNQKLLNQVEALISQMPADRPGTGMSKQEAALMAKIQQLYLQKSKLKREKKALETKLQDQAKEHEAKEGELRKQNERLHRLVMKQSEMITNQGLGELNNNEDLRRVLLAQAKSIEQLGISRQAKRLAHR